MIRTPRDIESNFRKTLGIINPLMCIADISLKELESNLEEMPLSNLTNKHKHNRLSVENIKIADALLYVHLAHITYINSRAESFCNEVIKLTNMLTKNSDSYDIDPTDKLRKTIILIQAKKKKVSKTTKKLDESVYIKFCGQAELLIVDYFRKLRNIEMHESSKSNELKFECTPQERIEIMKKFKHSPNDWETLNIRDVILYSQAWQSLAVNLCSNIVDIDNGFLNKLKKKYANDDKVRRDNAIRQKLRQDYLQPAHIVSMLEHSGWVA
ncbi:hypothetical protein A6833_09970 [Salmonella enterica]|uniref:Uncharacterized protein n=1 Tax=Salmonella diarizonae TaxID=59204 RepID=A0A5U3CRH3_SALDZ|nr:hypothetical protein [Salmonella enterica]EBP3409932.1 hypothetical protein [Salmonella enterica subsp. diarizonae]EEN6469024.1 hypothetical protein [Salmonella enterica subsp. enterica]EBP3693596.1 hypothetical protein [Salmonella enterica subsp. diarizonae]EBQ3514092.1 hypothetical protein [Salmonella enterica]